MSEETKRENHLLALRLVGQLQALNALAKHVGCMQGDRRTNDHIDSIRMLTNKAFLSAWEYAEQYAPTVSAQHGK
jgi:hypothetical protein